MIVQVYEGNNAISVFEKGKHTDEDCITLLREIEGVNWEGCMKQHHELMGWEPYKPID